MNDYCELPFVTPEKTLNSRSIKDIVQEIKDGTTKEYKELSNMYNITKGEKKNEKIL